MFESPDLEMRTQKASDSCEGKASVLSTSRPRVLSSGLTSTSSQVETLGVRDFQPNVGVVFWGRPPTVSPAHVCSSNAHPGPIPRFSTSEGPAPTLKPSPMAALEGHKGSRARLSSHPGPWAHVSECDQGKNQPGGSKKGQERCRA